MKKVIGIYCGDFTYGKGDYWDSDIIRANGAGGSETWAVEIASAFLKIGFHCIIFGNPEIWHFDNEGVEYVPFYFFEKRCTYLHFDYFISSRRTDEITPYLECHNIYIISHEYGIFDKYWGNICDFNQLKMDKVKKIAVLSEWHLNETKKLYPLLNDNLLFLTFNGINQELYKNIDNSKKRNMMVWSSCLNRGLIFFGQLVFPKIKKEIPDFELNICSYNTDIHGIIPKDENIHFLGSLNKIELAELQKTAKIWALPNYGLNDFGEILHESFCITAVENAMAENAIICFNKGGLTSTLKDYKGIIDINWFNEYENHNNDDLEKLSIIMSNNIIELLNNDTLRIEYANLAKNICLQYNWFNSALTWIKEWGIPVI